MPWSISVMALAIGCQPASKDTRDDKPYIAMIALGYGHQFWQAVRQGAEEAAKDYNVRITFEGPEEETMVDKQVDMLKTAGQ